MQNRFHLEKRGCGWRREVTAGAVPSVPGAASGLRGETVQGPVPGFRSRPPCRSRPPREGQWEAGLHADGGEGGRPGHPAASTQLRPRPGAPRAGSLFGAQGEPARCSQPPGRSPPGIPSHFQLGVPHAEDAAEGAAGGAGRRSPAPGLPAKMGCRLHPAPLGRLRGAGRGHGAAQDPDQNWVLHLSSCHTAQPHAPY